MSNLTFGKPYRKKPSAGLKYGPEGNLRDSGMLGLRQLDMDDTNARAYQFYPGLTKENATSHSIEPMLGWAHKDDVGDIGYTGYVRRGSKSNGGGFYPYETGNINRQMYVTNGMRIDDPKNSQHYRYSWVKDTHEKAVKDFEKGMADIEAGYRSGKIGYYEVDRKIKEMEDKFHEARSDLYRIQMHGYDVPLYVDFLNPRGW